MKRVLIVLSFLIVFCCFMDNALAYNTVLSESIPYYDGTNEKCNIDKIENLIYKNQLFNNIGYIQYKMNYEETSSMWIFLGKNIQINLKNENDFDVYADGQFNRCNFNDSVNTYNDYLDMDVSESCVILNYGVVDIKDVCNIAYSYNRVKNVTLKQLIDKNSNFYFYKQWNNPNKPDGYDSEYQIVYCTDYDIYIDGNSIRFTDGLSHVYSMVQYGKDSVETYEASVFGQGGYGVELVKINKEDIFTHGMVSPYPEDTPYIVIDTENSILPKSSITLEDVIFVDNYGTVKATIGNDSSFIAFFMNDGKPLIFDDGIIKFDITKMLIGENEITAYNVGPGAMNYYKLPIYFNNEEVEFKFNYSEEQYVDSKVTMIYPADCQKINFNDFLDHDSSMYIQVTGYPQMEYFDIYVDGNNIYRVQNAQFDGSTLKIPLDVSYIVAGNHKISMIDNFGNKVPIFDHISNSLFYNYTEFEVVEGDLETPVIGDDDSLIGGVAKALLELPSKLNMGVQALKKVVTGLTESLSGVFSIFSVCVIWMPEDWKNMIFATFATLLIVVIVRAIRG